MKSQVVKRVNINLTKKELKNLEVIEEFCKNEGMNTSDCIRMAINSAGKLIEGKEFIWDGETLRYYL